MTSGKVAKRKRREVKAPAPVGKRAGATASPKVLVLGALVVVAIVAAIVGVVGLTGGGSEAKSSTARLTGATEVAQLYRGIPQSESTLGRPTAPVTLVEYVDLQCPYCRQFVAEAFPTLVQKYVRSGKVRVELRGLTFVGPDSERGMRAAQAAAKQNRMFHFVDLLYYNQGAENSGWLDDDMVRAAANSVSGLDGRRLQSDAGSSAVSDRLVTDSEHAQRDDVTGTPTLFVGPTGGTLTKVELASATDLASIEKAIAAASSLNDDS
jgi:protein-disulfide isomerase